MGRQVTLIEMIEDCEKESENKTREIPEENSA